MRHFAEDRAVLYNGLKAGRCFLTPPAHPLASFISIPLRIREIKQDKPVVLVCRSGARSAQACMFLAQNGYDNVYNLRGGIIGWASSGLQIALPQAI